MAPDGATLLVAEQFWLQGRRDPGARAIAIWRTPRSTTCTGWDSSPGARSWTARCSGFRRPTRSSRSGTGAHRRTVLRYLRRFRNLFPAGRGGTFAYQNMDHAMASGLEAADRILSGEIERLGRRRPEASPARQSA